MVKKELQIQQCCAVNRGLFRTVYSATSARLEHPLRYLEESSFTVLVQTAPIYDASRLYNRSVNPDRLPTPRMPRITDLSRLRTMGIRLSTCMTCVRPTLGDDPLKFALTIVSLPLCSSQPDGRMGRRTGLESCTGPRSGGERKASINVLFKMRDWCSRNAQAPKVL